MDRACMLLGPWGCKEGHTDKLNLKVVLAVVGERKAVLVCPVTLCPQSAFVFKLYTKRAPPLLCPCHGQRGPQPLIHFVSTLSSEHRESLHKMPPVVSGGFVFFFFFPWSINNLYPDVFEVKQKHEFHHYINMDDSPMDLIIIVFSPVLPSINKVKIQIVYLIILKHSSV